MQKVKAELMYLEKWTGEYKIPSTGEKAEDVYAVKYRYILRANIIQKNSFPSDFRNGTSSCREKETDGFSRPEARRI